MKTELEKQASGELYDAAHCPDIIKLLEACRVRCWQYNTTDPSDHAALKTILAEILGTKLPEGISITPPLHIDFGTNFKPGKFFYANYNLTVLDCAKVSVGDHAFFGPNVMISTAGHPTDPEQRKGGLEYAYPVVIGDDVWIGGNVSILPGVTIGSRCVIGAGSVVTRDIPDDSIAVGNPCRVIRKITAEDKKRYLRPPVQVAAMLEQLAQD